MLTLNHRILSVLLLVLTTLYPYYSVFHDLLITPPSCPVPSWASPVPLLTLTPAPVLLSVQASTEIHHLLVQRIHLRETAVHVPYALVQSIKDKGILYSNMIVFIPPFISEQKLEISF